MKTDYWATAFNHYKKMLEKWRHVKLEEIRDASGDLPVQKRMDEDGRRLLERMTDTSINIALTERGKLFRSDDFAALLETWHNHDCRSPCFIIGGPFGLAEKVIERCDCLLSLSSMTWPHELARVLLMEQLYRAHSIIAKTGYHH